MGHTFTIKTLSQNPAFWNIWHLIDPIHIRLSELDVRGPVSTFIDLLYACPCIENTYKLYLFELHN